MLRFETERRLTSEIRIWISAKEESFRNGANHDERYQDVPEQLDEAA